MGSIFTVIRDFGIIDSVAILICLFFIVRGFKQGASGEMGTMLAWLLTGVFFFFGFNMVMNEALSFHFLNQNPEAGRLVAFVITLCVSIGLLFLLRKVLTDSIGLAVPTPFNEILGCFFGLIKALLLIAFLCVCGMFDTKKGELHSFMKDSETVKFLKPFISKVIQQR